MSDQFSTTSNKIKGQLTADHLYNRSTILDWARSILPTLPQGMKIQDFGTGHAYCRILNTYVPGSINANRIINNPKNQYECMINLKLFQTALTKLRINIPFDMTQICKLKFTRNWQLVRLVHHYLTNGNLEEGCLTSEDHLKEDCIEGEKENSKRKRFPEVLPRGEESITRLDSLKIIGESLSFLKEEKIASKEELNSPKTNHSLFQKGNAALIDRIKEILLKDCHDTEKVRQLKTLLGLCPPQDSLIKIQEQGNGNTIFHKNPLNSNYQKAINK